MTDVFLSYKREDKAYARALAEALARRGLDVWWDVDLLPGERFTAEIEQVIERAKVAVVLWSERAIHSDYVLDEARLAKERGILVPARLDASQPPIGFRTVQTEDLSAWDAAPASPVIAGLVDAVARRAGKTPEPDASDAETADHLHGRDAEAKLWESIRTNPAPSIAEYRLYLDRYPDGLFADLARLRVAALETDAAEAARRARRPAPMKLVAGATAIVVLVGGVFGLITQWPEVAEVVVPERADAPPSIEGDAVETEPATPTDAVVPRSSVLKFLAEADDVAGGSAPDAAQPEELPDLATFTDTLADGSPCGFCPEMVVIPAGTFTMGSPPEEEGRYDDEGPQREVRVERFALGRNEVTFAQYDACVDAGGCAERPDDEGWGRGERPVINVSWQDAQAYVDWLGEATGELYRLPSEAEWEYAARAGTTTRFAFGDELSSSEANFARNIGRTWEVGAGPANDWGLFDVHGNVWEWVEDCWNGSYDGASFETSPLLQNNGGACTRRVVRGGSWDNLPRYLRSAYRNRNGTDFWYYTFGFRVARTLTP
jgi:formylglycine-generating enzyme required for sulfatase activity